ncbi:hypothetical protein ACWATR_29490 [Nostoc sp. UIC 10890]
MFKSNYCHAIAADLTQPWSRLLLQQGFDINIPTIDLIIDYILQAEYKGKFSRRCIPIQTSQLTNEQLETEVFL